MDLSEIINIKYVVYYLIIINCIGFLAMFIDKVKAERNRWRIPENTLFTITMIGGGIGTILGMYVCRHKTKNKICNWTSNTYYNRIYISYIYIGKICIKC